MSTLTLQFSIDDKNFITTMILLMLGILIASLYTIFIKKFRGEFVMALIDAGAFNEETAKSTNELGIKFNGLQKMIIEIKFSFSPDYKVTNENEKKYYVKEDDIPRLTSKYGKSGITLIQLFITIIAFFAVALVMATIIPDILNMFNF